MNHRQRASLIPKVDHSQKITNQLIRKILSHLSIFDICRSSRVCRRWREIVENDPKMFEYVNIEKIPQNVSLFSILKIFTRDKQILSLILPPQASQTDTSYLLGQLPPTIQQITFNNINMEFGKIFIRPMANVKKITFSNQTKRKKPFDEIEIKSLLMLSSTAQLNLFSIPFDDAIVNALKNFNNLLELTILDSPNLSNNTLQLLAKNCPGLLHLCLGGSEKLYNQLITKEGIQECKLESIELHYIARLGDDSIDIISKAMPNLKKFKIVRNNFERCAKISDASLKSLTRNNLTHLSIIYTRKLRKECHNYLSQFSNLVYLCMKDCPLQQDLSILTMGCPLLQEVDFSGDSWVSQRQIEGLSKHPSIKIFWMGHFEHGDQDCDKRLNLNPPEGIFLEALFKKQQAFRAMHTIHLEHNCNLTYWLYSRISKLRPYLFIK